MMRALALVVAVLCTSSVPAQFADEWCGRGGSELPDLWAQTWLQLEALEEVPGAEAWTNAPSRVSMFLRNATLLHRASVRQGTKTMEQAQDAAQFFSGLRSRVIDAANARHVNTFTQTLAQFRSRLEKLQTLYLPEALQPMAAVPTPSKPTLTVSTRMAPVVVGQPVEVKFRLQDAQGRGVSSLNLIETHTRKLHAMLVDPTLEDYHHEHPITAGPPGVFNFIFTPRKPGDYLLWLDVMPQSTARNEYPHAMIPGAKLSLAAPSLDTRMDSTSDGFRHTLRLQPATVKAGKYVSARLRVTDDKGRPCFQLEPLMGAFAHVVGFMDDRKTMLHVHSHGEPPREHERSGPEVPFRFVAPKAGHLKLFVQTQVNGQIHLASFSFPVE